MRHLLSKPVQIQILEDFMISTDAQSARLLNEAACSLDVEVSLEVGVSRWRDVRPGCRGWRWNGASRVGKLWNGEADLIHVDWLERDTR